MSETELPQQSINDHTLMTTIAALEAARNAADIIRALRAEVERLKLDNAMLRDGITADARRKAAYARGDFSIPEPE